jgi:hypothetical protein
MVAALTRFKHSLARRFAISWTIPNNSSNRSAKVYLSTWLTQTLNNAAQIVRQNLLTISSGRTFSTKPPLNADPQANAPSGRRAL